MRKAYKMSLMISFVVERMVERVDGDALWACLSFMQEGGDIHGAKSYVFSGYFTRAKRANEVSDLPAPELSPALVLVLTCLTVAPLVCLPTIAHITRL